jgi:general secretion pathway protein D
MRITVCAGLALFVLMMAGVARTETEPTPAASPPDGSMPIQRLLASVAKKSGKTFIVDPRVRADVILVGHDAASVSYNELMSILQVYGFTALESGGFVRIVPDAVVRQLPLPFADKDKRADTEYVNAVVTVKNVPAAQLVPILRPLLPQQAHLAAFPCTNNLIMVDTYGNVKRIEAIVRSLDTGTPFRPESCAPAEPKPRD